ncbi:hypothetical protein M434DRAFT_211927 [Hypoxylon sp. CO27-5]|nr:hypothetical protein M434DRAFT_211927 [Hypoxylon sp. CO27-5]
MKTRRFVIIRKKHFGRYEFHSWNKVRSLDARMNSIASLVGAYLPTCTYLIFYVRQARPSK